jgi:hypothetical protein
MFQEDANLREEVMRLSLILAGLSVFVFVDVAMAQDEAAIDALNAKFMADFVKNPASVVEYYTGNATTLPDKAPIIMS